MTISQRHAEVDASAAGGPPTGNPIRRWLLGITGGAVAFPLVILFLLYFFDQFDTAAFGVLAPRIEEAFGLSDKQFLLILILNVSLVLLAAVPISHFGDRLPRNKMVVIGGLLAGTFSFLTGAVGTTLLLVIVRVGNGIGQVVNDPIHTSLLADYYRPEHRPRVYSIHRNAVQVGAIFGYAVAGTAALVAGWRAAFFILIAPIAIVSLLALRLQNPRRGATDDATAAAEVESEKPIAFGPAYRSLIGVRTLRRQYWAYFWLGAGVIPLVGILPLYFKRVYNIGDFGRGLILAGNAGFQFAGLLIAGNLTRRWLARGLGEPIKRTGWVLIGVGIGLPLVAVSPNLPIALVVGWVTSFVAGMYFPGFLTTQALVSPARVRTLSFGLGAAVLVAGVWLGYIIPASFFPGVYDTAGHHIRGGLAILGPYWIIAGLLLASAQRFVERDTTTALSSLSTTVEQRRLRLSAEERSMLVCVGVDVAYDSVQVLFGVNLEIREGEIVALLGTNGAGKSTLLRAISGLTEPSGGAIIFDGEDVTHSDPKARAKLGIVQMPGGRSVFPTLTVNECLRIAAWIYRKQPGDYVKVATERALGYFPVLRQRGETQAGNLSGGEQQMLGLAMALISKPKLLMIDELSLGLAPAIVGQLVDIVRAIHDEGTTIILVEQSVNVALMLAQRAVFMEKGEVRFSGPTADLLGRGDILRSVFLEGAASAVGVDIDVRPDAEPDGRDNGHRAAAAAAPVAEQRVIAADAPIRLELRDIVVRFGAVRAVDGASLILREGEVLGLIGPNGAGKTTIFDVVSGFVKPASGRVILDGVDVTEWSPDRRSWAGLGRSFQDARIFPSLTVVENLAVAFERHMDVRDPVAAALGLPAVQESENDTAWKVHDLVELLGLGSFRNKFVSELSTGSRRIVDLGMAIAHQPRVLILDEPSSGIAQREAEALGPLLLRIQREIGCSLLVIEHDMPLITSVADTMVALELGAVVTSGTPHEVVNDPQVVASYLGDDQGVIARSGALTQGSDPSETPNRPPARTSRSRNASRNGTSAAAKRPKRAAR